MGIVGSKRGYSLVEVVTVLGMMGILTAMATPLVTTLVSEANLISVQREVMSALYIGRSSAIANNAPRLVIITPPALPGSGTLIQIQDQSGNRFYNRNLKAYGPNMTVTGPNPSDPTTITYDGRGLLTPATSITLSIGNGIHQTKTVTVYPTGKPSAS